MPGRRLEVVGAPFVDPTKLLAELESFELTGLHLRPIRFLPTFHKWHGQSCGGLCLHVTDPRTFQPVRTSVALITAIQRLWPRAFAWRDPPYEYETQKSPIDILFGNSLFREGIERETVKTAADVDRLIALDKADWRKRVAPYLLYGG